MQRRGGPCVLRLCHPVVALKLMYEVAIMHRRRYLSSLCWLRQAFCSLFKTSRCIAVQKMKNLAHDIESVHSSAWNPNRLTCPCCYPLLTYLDLHLTVKDIEALITESPNMFRGPWSCLSIRHRQRNPHSSEWVQISDLHFLYPSLCYRK